MEKLKIPYHVGIILDGNGRWATERGLKRSEGHKADLKHLKYYQNTYLLEVLKS